MKRLAGLSVLAMVLTSTGGCGWLWGQDGYFRDRGSDYLEARQSAPMRLPEGVQAKSLDPLLPVPRQIASLETRGTFEVPRPQPLQVDSGSEFSLQKSGESRWVLAQRPPAEVWPLARQFFESNGFRIASEQARTGEFSTDWQRYDNLPASLARRLSGRVAVSAPDAQTRVRVRIEPGVQRNTSEVFVVSAERPAGSTANVDFPSRSSNTSLDGALLEELLTSLERSTVQGGSVSLAARDFNAPSRVSLSEDGNGNPLLNLGTDFDRAWANVGRALEMSDLRIDDLNRSLGIYYVDLAKGAQKAGDKPGFFSRLFGGSDEGSSGDRYQVRLTRVGDSVQVSLEKDADTLAPADISRRVLRQLQENLG
jgi:outer membrane protein assembly factor BamC